MLEASRAITKVSVMERLNDHLLGDCQKLDEIKNLSISGRNTEKMDQKISIFGHFLQNVYIF